MTSDLLIGDLANLPIGVLVCELTKGPPDPRKELVITYQNPFASALLGASPTSTTSLLLRDIPLLQSLTETAFAVLETGVSLTTELFDQDKGQRIDCSLHRVKGKCVFYVKTDTAKTTKSNNQPDRTDNYLIESLRASNQLFQAVIDTIPSGLALLQPIRQNGTIVDFKYLVNNPVNSAITGLSQEAILKQPLLVLFPHLLHNGLFRMMVEVALTGEAQHIQLQDQLPSGAFWGNFSMVRVGENVLFTVHDITRLKQVEDELRQTNAELEQRVANRSAEVRHLSALQRAILQYAGLAITVIDTNGIIQLVNPAMEDLTGYSTDELIGKVTPSSLREPVSHQQRLDQLKPDLNNAVLEGDELVRAFVTKNNFLRRENTLLSKNGQAIPVLSTVSGLYDDEQKLIGFVDIITDISHLKAIEQALVQANQRSQLATRAGKLSIWEWNLLTDEILLDENFYTYYDLPDNTRIYCLDDIKQLVHPDDLRHFNQYIQEVSIGQKPFDVEFRIILPITKTIHYIKADGSFIHNEEGLGNRMIGILWDRTSERQAGQALRASEQRYRSLVDHLKEIVFQTDANGLWIYLNPAWEEVTGFANRESVGTFFLDYIFPEDRISTIQLFEAIRKNQKLLVQHTIRYIHKDGGYRWIDVHAQVMLDNRRVMTGITGTLTDITERKKAEEAIIESEQRFRDIAENVDEIFWIRDINEPRFTYINRAYEKFTGQLAESIYKNSLLFLDFIVEEDRARVMNYFVRNGKDSSFQFRARHQNGSIRHLDVKLFKVDNDEGVLIRRIGVATDVTTAIEKELIMEESLQKERTLNVLKSQFISTASHEFRTPLTVISSSVELVKYYTDSNPGNPSVINKHLNTISKKVTSLNNLIDDTLAISKIDNGKIEIKVELTDLVSLIDSIVTFSFSDRDDNRHVERIIVGTPVAVSIDKKLTDHVITNLLSNAFKFSTQNPVLTINFQQEDITVAVSDKGIGIPAKDIPDLFGKFFRASNASGFQGTGLGLAICQEYITLQKGRISLDSKEGVGTTFTIFLGKNISYPQTTLKSCG